MCQFHQHFIGSFFRRKCFFFAVFLYLQFGFYNFLWKNIGTTATRKMFVKLTIGVNFINILRTNFSYEPHFGSFFYLRFGFGKNLYKKCVRITLMKLTIGVSRQGLTILPHYVRCMEWVKVRNRKKFFRNNIIDQLFIDDLSFWANKSNFKSILLIIIKILVIPSS